MKKRKMKKKYMQEVAAVNEVITTLTDAAVSNGVFSVSDDEGTRKVSREEGLQAIIEWSIDKLVGSVGYVFENETFSLRYYNWGNHDDESDDENIFHFYHKPSGLKIGWYKHPFRAALCNMEVNHEEFRAVLYDCRNSIQRSKVLVKEWWKE